MTRWTIAVSLLLLFFVMVGCASVSSKLPAAPRIGYGPPESQPEYRLQAGDVVELDVATNPELTQQAIVNPDGRVSFQYAPNIAAAGHTLPEVSKTVAADYHAANESNFQVVLRSTGGTRVYVTGEVALPSEVVVNGPISALGAISRAGGFKITAQTGEVVLMRLDNELKPQLFAIDAGAAMDGTDPGANVQLQPYDVLYVPRDRFSNVSLLFERIRNAIPFSSSFSYAYFLNSPTSTR